MKLDKNYKVRVTPEQSRKIQELLFVLGGVWFIGHDGKRPAMLNADYLFLHRSMVLTYAYEHGNCYFENKPNYTEIQADDLIALLTDLSKSAENPLQGVELTPEFEAAETVLADNSVNIQDIGTDILDTNADIKDTPKFKVGDPVYWGLKSRIFKIHRFMSTNVLEVELDGGVTSVHKDELCPATLENYGKLCSLFECIDFEQPPKPLTGDDIVRAMLKKGIKNILCLWGSGDKIIIDRLDYKGSLMSADCRVVGGLKPIDWYTGEPLTEAVLDE